MEQKRRVMLWLLAVLGVLLGVPLVAGVVGTFLPRDHVARLSIDLHTPRERVWELVADVGGTARWRRDVKEVKVQTAEGGAVRFVEKSKNGETPFEIMLQEAPRHQVVRVADETLPFGGTWTWDLAPLGDGTRLTITEAGFIENPLFRVMSKLFFPPAAAIDAYLRDLAKELGEIATPGEAAGR